MSDAIHDLTGQGRTLEDYEKALLLKSGGGGGTFDDMEARVQKLEDAFLRVDRSLDRMDQRFDAFQSDISATRVSLAKIEERMDRVMDRARDIPTEAKIDSMITSKLGLSALLLAAVGILIAAITYAAS